MLANIFGLIVSDSACSRKQMCLKKATGLPGLSQTEDAIFRGVPGDFIETGVWRGGLCCGVALPKPITCSFSNTKKNRDTDLLSRVWGSLVFALLETCSLMILREVSNLSACQTDLDNCWGRNPPHIFDFRLAACRKWTNFDPLPLLFLLSSPNVEYAQNSLSIPLIFATLRNQSPDVFTITSFTEPMSRGTPTQTVCWLPK